MFLGFKSEKAAALNLQSSLKDNHGPVTIKKVGGEQPLAVHLWNRGRRSQPSASGGLEDLRSPMLGPSCNICVGRPCSLSPLQVGQSSSGGGLAGVAAWGAGVPLLLRVHGSWPDSRLPRKR